MIKKSELVEKISQRSGLSKKAANEIFDAVVEEICNVLKDGDSVTLSGLGSFQITERAERTGHNLRTGEKIVIQARKAIRFKQSSKMKEALNN